MILTEIGEVGIEWRGKLVKLRPSLHSMTQLGDGREIVRVYASVMSDTPHRDQFPDALAVLYACAGDHDISEAVGYYEANEQGLTEYRPGLADPQDILTLARCLVKHGITGDLPELPRRAGDEPSYSETFDARENALLAMAHLGLSRDEAWSITMTELVGALRAKFPRPESTAPGSRAPTLTEHEATMAWFDKVQAARNKKRGGNG